MRIETAKPDERARHDHWHPPGDPGDGVMGDGLCCVRARRVGETPAWCERVAMWLALGATLGSVALLLAAPALQGAQAGGAQAVRCEQFGFPSAVPGVSPAVCWNGPIAFALDGRSKNPAWAMTVLTPRTLAGGAVRRERFAADPRVPAAWRTAVSDYAGTAYDRGHLVASAFFGRQAERDATFALTNIAPQHPALNRGAWRAIEARIAQRVRDERRTAVLVVIPLYPRATGPAGQRRVVIDVIGQDVWVPDRFALAVLWLARGHPEAMEAWILPNDASASGADGRVSVNDVQREAALDLFWALDDEVEDRLEAMRSGDD